MLTAVPHAPASLRLWAYRLWLQTCTAEPIQVAAFSLAEGSHVASHELCRARCYPCSMPSRLCLAPFSLMAPSGQCLATCWDIA